MKPSQRSEIVTAVMALITDNPSTIALKTGLSKTTAWRIVNNMTDPSSTIIEKIMKAYDIDWKKLSEKITSSKGVASEEITA